MGRGWLREQRPWRPGGKSIASFVSGGDGGDVVLPIHVPVIWPVAVSWKPAEDTRLLGLR